MDEFMPSRDWAPEMDDEYEEFIPMTVEELKRRRDLFISQLKSGKDKSDD